MEHVAKVTDVKHGSRTKQTHSFPDLKQDLLDGLQYARSQHVVDVECDAYIDMINAVPHYMTSSSCYGRICLLYCPDDEKKLKTIFIGKWHREVTVDEVWDRIMMCVSGTTAAPVADAEEGHTPEFAVHSIPKECHQVGDVWLRMDPLIIHVSCDTVDSANALLKIKTEAGVRRGG